MITEDEWNKLKESEMAGKVKAAYDKAIEENRAKSVSE